MNDKEKIEKLTPFDETKYENIDLDHLIMYVMGQLEKIGVDLSFENAVVASFKLFPKKFSMSGFMKNFLKSLTIWNRNRLIKGLA